ncbi:hypothetical protein II906_07540 [bacterium]|nr:hypothetical protein [bacterium]
MLNNCSYYPVEIVNVVDKEPRVSAKKENGQQEISLYDSKLSGRRSIITSSDKIDEFISNRNKNNKQKGLLTILGLVTGGIVGAAVTASHKNLSISLLGSMVGSCLAGVACSISHALSDNKLTQKFIKENK